MHRVAAAPNEAALLGPLLDEFIRWTIPRMIAAVVSFCAMMFALTFVALGRSERAA